MVTSKFTNLIDLSDMPISWWNEIVSLGAKIAKEPEKYAHECDGKIMGTLFYEPSTRTQMSFRTAMWVSPAVPSEMGTTFLETAMPL